MKTKKALAVILAVVMLVMPLAVSSFAATANGIITNPVKTVYNDSEYFNPVGIVVCVNGDIITYTPQDTKFRFEPALNELLTVETAEVFVYYDNEIVGTVPVTVDHILGDLVSIDKGHGKYCLGCGTLHEYEEHTITNWIPNDDGGIFTLQTRTGKCDVCGGEVTEAIPDTSKFMNLFDMSEGSMTDFETEILSYITMYLFSFIQMILGIY